MNEPKERKYCRVKNENNMQLITMPNGEIIPCQVFSRVTNVVNEKPYAILKVIVDLDDTEKE